MSNVPYSFGRPALRYFGGKWRLAPWILSHFPPHICYVETHGGAMSVLLQKTPANYEVYNDIDGDLCAFFRVLRERPDALRRAILLTPYSRAELRLSCEPVPPDWDGGLIDRALEQARRIFVRCWQGFGSGMADSPGWRYDTGKASRNGTSSLAHGLADFRDIDRLPQIAARLLSVQIEGREAVDVIARFDTPRTLFFLDPPYLPETRSKSRQTRGYRHEMTVQDHIALAGALSQVQGMAIVCGYPSALYESLYDGWACVRIQSRTQNFAKKATECLWLSPSVTACGRNLFSEAR